MSLVFGKQTNIEQHFAKYQNMFGNLLDFVQSGAVQRCIKLADLQKMLQTETLITKIGFDTDENKLPKHTYIPSLFKNYP